METKPCETKQSNADALYNFMQDHVEHLKHERYTRLVFVLSILIGIVGIFIGNKLTEKITSYHLMSFALLCCMLAFNIHFFSTVFSFKHLHHIRIKRRKATFASHLFIPYGYEEDKNIPLSSISALVATRGSNVERMFSFTQYSIAYGSKIIIVKIIKAILI